MTYRAPLDDIGFALKYGAALGPAIEQGLFGDLSLDDVEAVLAEAGRFAGEVIAPLNRVGDTFGTPIQGRRRHHGARLEGSLPRLAARPAGMRSRRRREWGGQALPQIVNAACTEMWHAASIGFANGPMLTMAAIDALNAHGSDTLKRTYLEKLVSGEWMGTMQLTEPQAGSDVGALRTRAERAGDGSYRLKGQKIFITYGEHDLTDNIIHFVLARLPDAPPGTRGISLFLVPKFLLKPDGSLGARNDMRAHSIEHKLGIHGSPTCTMILGDDGGAIGFLIGEENAGMACMFTMMNRARLAVGLQGVGIAEARHAAGAGLCARAQTGPRRRHEGDGNGADHRPSRCAAHAADHARAHAGRARHLLCDRHGDRSQPNAAPTPPRARPRMRRRRCSRRSPRRSRPTSPTRSLRSACRCMAAWAISRRPARRSSFATRGSRRSTKAPTASRRSISSPASCRWRAAPRSTAHSTNCAASSTALSASNDPAFGWTAVRLGDAVESLSRATDWLLANIDKEPDAALAGATPLSAAVRRSHRRLPVGEGGSGGAAAWRRCGGAPRASRGFLPKTIAVGAGALERTVVEGGAGVLAADAALAS